MKFCLCVCLLIVFQLSTTQGQNLIANGDFEQYKDCPSAFSQIELATGWFPYGSKSSPDYYHACASSPRVGVPRNDLAGIPSYQLPRSGDAYAGILTYDGYPREVKVGIEYIATELVMPMVAGQVYEVRFFVAAHVIDSSSASHASFSDAIGLTFVADTADLPFDECFHSLIPPSITNTGGVLSDTSGWMEVSGCYTATGSERYAIIGNFTPRDQITIIETDPSICCPFIYHLIEDVSVVAIDTIADEIIKCNDEPAELSVSLPSQEWSVQWDDGISENPRIFSETGQYTVTRSGAYCRLVDTVQVSAFESNRSYHIDTVACDDQAIVLNALPGKSVEWSDGSRTKTIAVNQSGLYSAQITVPNCGTSSFSANVTFEPCDCALNFPTVFSPNDDGVNDLFTAHKSCDIAVRTLSFLIFDRWGNLLTSLTASDDMPIWDGMADAKVLPTGVYVYLIEVETYSERLDKRRTFLHTGELMLVR